MSSIRFYLKRRADEKGILPDKDLQIELSYSFHGKRLQYYTGLRTDAKHFVPDYVKSGKPPIKKAAPNAEYLNDSIRSIKKHIEDYEVQCKHQGYAPKVEDFRKLLDQKIKGKGLIEDRKLRVLDQIQPFIQFTKLKNAHNTYRNTNSAMNHLIQFFEVSKRAKLLVEEMDQEVYDGFRAYLISLKHKNNTVVKHLARFRAFTKWLTDQGHFIASIKYDLQENDIDVIVLTKREVDQLRDAPFTDERSMRVRDIFIFGCNTALRYGDIQGLKKTDVYEGNIRFLIQKKGTTDHHSVPLTDESRRILAKYNDYPGEQALPCYSNQKMNQYLKDVMLAAGLTEKITIAEKAGDGKIKRVVKEKWEVITCHTSRKTATTFLLSSGVPEAVIKSITGHSKNSKAFAKYYSVSDKLKEEGMRQAFGAPQL